MSLKRRFRWWIAGVWWQFRKFLFVRVLHIADECMGCSRIIPREWRSIAAHLHFYGPQAYTAVLCEKCSNRESILEQFFYNPEWDEIERTCDIDEDELEQELWDEGELEDEDVYPPSDRFSLVE